MEAAAAARGRPLVRATAYGGAGVPRRVVCAGLATAPRRRRALVAVASLPEPVEPLPPRAQEGAVAVAPPQSGDEEAPGDDAAETSSPPAVPSKTVHVRFVLNKQCPFGQSFHLVGEDTALGLWDPSKAVALEWAEGHDWIAEKDLPANKLIEFKFLLRDSSGKLHWQIGPNRSLQTGETAKTLVVYEDWGDLKKQKIAEVEGEASIGMEESVVSDDGESKGDTVLEDELLMDDNREVKEDESIVGMNDEKSTVATNSSVQEQSVKENEAKPHESMLPEEPKLLDELHEEDTDNGSASCANASYAEKTEEGNTLCEDDVPVKNGLTGAYEHDLLWGWKALQQLLMSLGFKMDTT
uniref:CBM20 domain-containing protein n=1 Tax=Arundo donax TaxID=35708 RepID=A0A0A8YCR2_ARUDO